MSLAECFFSVAMKNIGLPRAESLVTGDKIFTSGASIAMHLVFLSIVFI